MLPNTELRELRLQRGLAQRALSVKSGVSVTTLSAIEKYGVVPGSVVRQRIAAALDVEAEQLWPTDTVAVA